MFCKTIAALFAGIVVTGLSSTVYAQTITPAPADSSFNTRSGESLRGLQNPSISKDYSTFSETSPLSGISPMSIRNNSAPRTRGVRLSDGVKVTAGSTFTSTGSSGYLEVNDQVKVSAGASPINSDEVLKVRYNLLSPAGN